MTLTITVVAFNVPFGAAWSALVLYASERLGLGGGSSRTSATSSNW